MVVEVQRTSVIIEAGRSDPLRPSSSFHLSTGDRRRADLLPFLLCLADLSDLVRR